MDFCHLYYYYLVLVLNKIFDILLNVKNNQNMVPPICGGTHFTASCLEKNHAFFMLEKKFWGFKKKGTGENNRVSESNKKAAGEWRTIRATLVKFR